MSRQNFSKAILVARFKHAGGRCEWLDPDTKIRCNAVLIPGRWHGDHDNPDGLTGKPTFENCRCLCLPHHAIKTKADVSAIAQAKRREANAIGARRPKQQLQSGGSLKGPQRTHEGRGPAVGLSEIARRFGLET